MKLDIDQIHKNRIAQIELDLKQEYYKGKKKNKRKIAKLLQEKSELGKLI